MRGGGGWEDGRHIIAKPASFPGTSCVLGPGVGTWGSLCLAGLPGDPNDQCCNVAMGHWVSPRPPAPGEGETGHGGVRQEGSGALMGLGGSGTPGWSWAVGDGGRRRPSGP